MKKFVIFIFAITFLGFANAQDFCLPFLKKTIVINGIDFSKTKCVKLTHNTFNKPEEITDIYFPAMNNFVVENYKYLSFSRLKYKTIIYDIQKAFSRISLVKPDELVTNKLNFIPPEEIDEIVSDYTSAPGNLNLLFICESLVKQRDGNYDESYATFWVVFFSDGKVIIKEKMQGDAGGIGFTMFWMTSLKNVIKQINMNDLRKRYCPKK